MSESHDDSPRKAAAPKMKTRAKADAMSVENLLRLVRAGRVRMPEFQRAFRWDGSDRRALLDSIYRGYPVGTVLLWKNPPRGAEGGRSPIGTNEAPAAGDTFLVVDGQQRITTLWDALGRRPDPEERTLVFEMQSEEFRYRRLARAELDQNAPSSAGMGLPDVPLHVLLDAATLSEWVPPDLSREDKRRYFELGSQLREYQLALYVVEDADLNMLRHVFDRVNTTGKTMTRDEVFDALVGSRVVSDGAAGLGLVNARIRDLGFGDVDTGTILNAFEAIRGTSIGRLDPRELDRDVAETELLRTGKVLRDVVAFLRMAGVPHYAVCPYELPIVVLARFLALFPKPSSRSEVLLRRWFWRGAIAERLGGASGSMQQHVDDILEEDEHGSVQRLLTRTGSRDGVPLHADARDKFSLAHARGKTYACALLAQAPRHLVTGERIEVAELFRNGASDTLRRVVPSEGATSPLAGKLLHPSTPASAKRIILACGDEGALMSHGIDRRAVEALRQGDAAGFVDARAGTLDRWIRTFFDGHAECERDDTPPLAALARRRA